MREIRVPMAAVVVVLMMFVALVGAWVATAQGYGGDAGRAVWTMQLKIRDQGSTDAYVLNVETGEVLALDGDQAKRVKMSAK